MSTDKPSIDFNLDAYTPTTPTTPFNVVLGGKRYELAHIDDLDGWKFIEAFEDGENTAPRDILKLALGEQWEDFRKHRLAKGSLDELVNRYLKHSGIDTGN